MDYFRETNGNEAPIATLKLPIMSQGSILSMNFSKFSSFKRIRQVYYKLMCYYQAQIGWHLLIILTLTFHHCPTRKYIIIQEMQSQFAILYGHL